MTVLVHATFSYNVDNALMNMIIYNEHHDKSPFSQVIVTTWIVHSVGFSLQIISTIQICCLASKAMYNTVQRGVTARRIHISPPEFHGETNWIPFPQDDELKEKWGMATVSNSVLSRISSAHDETRASYSERRRTHCRIRNLLSSDRSFKWKESRI